MMELTGVSWPSRPSVSCKHSPSFRLDSVVTFSVRALPWQPLPHFSLLLFFFSCGTFLILSSRIIYLLWFLFLSVSLRDWKFYKGKDVCLCLLLNSQCLEWHPVHKEIFVEWMNALIPISECLLHPIPSGLEVIGLGFEYWLCHKLPLSLSKSLNLAAL